MQIQLGHPKINQDEFPVFESVRDGFLRLFRDEEESIYLFWHDAPLRFRYREDLFQNFDALLAMVWLVHRDNQGVTKVDFTTQLLSIHWEIHWDGDDLLIRSTFIESNDLYGLYAKALNRLPELRMSTQAFLSEWKTLLHQIIVSFQSGRVEIQDGTERRKWELLQRVDQNLPQYGQLYVRSA